MCVKAFILILSLHRLMAVHIIMAILHDRLKKNSTRIFFLPTFTVTLFFFLIKRKYGRLDFQRHLLEGRCSNIIDFYGIYVCNFPKILP